MALHEDARDTDSPLTAGRLVEGAAHLGELMLAAAGGVRGAVLRHAQEKRTAAAIKAMTQSALQGRVVGPWEK